MPNTSFDTDAITKYDIEYYNEKGPIEDKRWEVNISIDQLE